MTGKMIYANGISWCLRSFLSASERASRKGCDYCKFHWTLIRIRSDVFLFSVPLLAIRSSAIRARFSRFNISLRRMPRLIYGFCRATASRVWVGVRIHKRVVLVMQIRERVGERKRYRAKERWEGRRVWGRRRERGMTNAVNINSSWSPSGRLRIVAAQVPKMAKSFVNIEELLGQLWK